MSTHNICFHGEIRKIIPELSPDILLNKSSEDYPKDTLLFGSVKGYFT